MPTLVSLDTQVFWSPSIVTKSPLPPLLPQQSGQGVASDPVCISSDEDSNVESGLDDGAINEALSDDALLLDVAICPSMASTQSTQTETKG